MDKDYLIQLTNNLYRLTLLFPKKEPLRYKMREIAGDILIDLINRGPSSINLTENGALSGLGGEEISIISQLEVLDSFFEVAKAQNWLSPNEVSKVQEEYNKIKAEIKKTAKRPPEPPTTTTGSGGGQVINSRQEKILEFLKENGRTQVWQVKRIFPEVTKRTLRRDFENMLKQGIIKRIGERNNTFYRLPVSAETTKALDQTNIQRTIVGQP